MSADPLIGKTVGGCMVLEVIGQGGMGVIYKARQNSLDRIVALKVLARHLANDINFVARFQKEARAIARVNHPNILAVYDVGADEDTNYMIMELIDGRSLAEVQTERRGAIAWEEATDYVRQSAQGLEAAQAAGIIHRDIKPENLMVTKKKVIKVSDFGLAKDTDNSNNTSVDAVMGTPAFMSPEQCDGKKVDHRSDIYSLGGTYYRLVTGRLPFDAETAMSMMYRHKHEALIPPHEVVKGLPPQLSEVICKMMAKKREARHQTMTEVIEAMDAAKESIAAETGASRSQLAMAVPPPPAPGIHPVPMPGVPAPNVVAETSPMSSGDSNVMRRDSLGIPAEGGSGRMLAAAAPEGAFAPSVSSAHMNMPSSIMRMAPGGLGVPDEGYNKVSQGDEMMSRGDKLAALKLYRMALQSPALDNATRVRIDGEIRKEVSARKQAAESLFKRAMLVEASREWRIITDLDPADGGAKAALKDIEAKLAVKRTVVNDIRTAIAASNFDKAIQLWDTTPSELREDSLGKQIDQLRTVVVPSFKLAQQGEKLNDQGRIEEAISTFEDALKINPTCEPARIGLKDAQSKMQRIDFMLKEGYQHNLDQNYVKAIETWKPVLNLRPNHPQAVKSMVEAYCALGQNLRAQGDLEGALNSYRGAAEIDPGNRTVKRVVEELTNLYDKEQALIDRAQDAIAHGKLGAALSYWKEVQTVNPPSRRAAEQVNRLGRQRSSKSIVALIAILILAAGGTAGYHYYNEMKIVGDSRRINQRYRDVFSQRDPAQPAEKKAMPSPSESRQLQEAQEALRTGTFWFQKVEADQQLDEARVWSQIEKAQKEEKEGQVVDAAKSYKELSSQLGHFDSALGMKLGAEAVSCNLQRYQRSAESALSGKDFEGALKEYQNIQDLLRSPEAQNRFPRDEQIAEQSINALKTLNEALHAEKNSAINYFVNAQKQIGSAGLKLTGVDEFIKDRLDAIGYKPNEFQVRLAAGIEKLKAGDLKGAEKLFREAQKDNAVSRDVSMWLDYTVDLLECDKDNMSLYAPTNPISDKAWGRDQRSQSFCIDRYEWPNNKGEIPRGGVTFLEAREYCRTRGKTLCSSHQWEQACKGDNLINLYPYGTKADPKACNTDGSAVTASGARAECHNSIGVYDMSGNLAEWTDDGDDSDSLAKLMGGSFKSSAAKSTCTEPMGQNKKEKPADAGFRCCRVLK